MKKALLILLITAITWLTGYAQGFGNCTVPAVFYEAYQDDVGSLAYDRFNKFADSTQLPTRVPQSYRDTIWQGFAAILNSNSPQSDSVFNQYCVHYHHRGLYKYLSIYTSNNVVWSNNWLENNINTGNVAVDTILANYGYILLESDGNTERRYANFQTEQEVYFPGLEQLLMENVAGITSIARGNGFGYGDRISYEKEDNLLYFTFMKSGVLGAHEWRFQVNLNTCEVIHLGSQTWDKFGDLDVPENCNIFTMAANEIKVYPIPAMDWVKIEAEDIQSIKLINALGAVVSYETYSMQDAVTIPTVSLATGVYFAQVVTAKGSFKRRVVVQ